MIIGYLDPYGNITHHFSVHPLESGIPAECCAKSVQEPQKNISVPPDEVAV